LSDHALYYIPGRCEFHAHPVLGPAKKETSTGKDRDLQLLRPDFSISRGEGRSGLDSEFPNSVIAAERPAVQKADLIDNRVISFPSSLRWAVRVGWLLRQASAQAQGAAGPEPLPGCLRLGGSIGTDPSRPQS